MLSALFKKKSSFNDFLFNASPEVILYLDLKGKIARVNKRVYDWLQISPKELEGKSIFDLAIISPQSKDLIKKNFRKRIRGEKIEPFDITCYKKNGEEQVGRITAKLIKDKKNPVGILVLISNVTLLERDLKEKLTEVRESEIRYKGLFDNIKSAAVICEFLEDKKGFKITQVNSHLLKIERLNKKDVLGRKLRTLFPGVNKDEICAVVTKAWKDTHGSVDFEFEISKNKKVYIRQGRIYRLPTDELVVLYNDATEEIEYQQKIEDQEKKFRSIFENVNDAIFLMDGNKFIDCNSKTLDIYGCEDKSDLIGKTPLDFSPAVQPDGKSSKRKALKYIRSVLNGRHQKFYWQHSKKDGESFDAEVALKKLVLGGEIFIQAIVRDITKQKESEEKLKQSENKFRTIVENIEAIVFMIDTDGIFTFSEVKKLSLLGLKPGQVVGTSAFEMYKDYPVIISALKESLKGEVVTNVIQVGDIYSDIFFSPYKDSKGKIIGVLGMAIDVTDRELAMSRLIEIDQKKNEFIGMASHQLRTPIGNMRWELEGLMKSKDYKEDEKLISSLKTIYSANLRLIDLVSNLLNISRIEGGKVLDKPVKMDLISMISDIVSGLESKIEDKNLQIRINAPERLSINYDPKLIREVVGNLITNALKFNKKNGLVVIEVVRSGDKFTLRVANTGKTILKSDQEHIFEKFFRGTNILDEVIGTGLGLHICKEYIKKWGGVITFKSPAHFSERSMNSDKYKGTIFRVELPVSVKK